VLQWITRTDRPADSEIKTQYCLASGQNSMIWI